MPTLKLFPTLYDKCVKIVYEIISDFCTGLERCENREIKVKEGNEFLIGTLPISVLNSILSYQQQLNIGCDRIDAHRSFYFYKVILHKYVKCFHAKYHELSISCWKNLLKPNFSNIVQLNLGIVCTDSMLHLVAKYCPLVEYLNATCKPSQANTMKSMPVTDQGLDYLCTCKHLKTLIIFAPPNLRFQNGITYSGIRKLLTEVKTLEDITYADTGAVLSNGMDTVDTLNLKVIRHMNGTKDSVKTICRLCTNLQEFYLFNTTPQYGLVDEFIEANLKLKLLDVRCLSFGTKFDQLFHKLGDHLLTLSISNHTEPITYQNLQIIGQYCPNLTYLNCDQIDTSNDEFLPIVSHHNNQHFTRLETLSLVGVDIKWKFMLGFCTQYANNLENIYITERYRTSSIDQFFIKSNNLPKLRHIEISSKLIFSKSAIEKIIGKYSKLKYLNVYCADDCTGIVQYFQKHNRYDFSFVNKKTTFFDY